MILCIKTDQPDAELALLDSDGELVVQHTWHAHRQLAATLHLEIDALLKQAEVTLDSISALAVYRGPGSFTGLRIGVAVANALGYSLGVPVVGVDGDEWIAQVIEKLPSVDNRNWVVPEYGQPPTTTTPRK